MKLSHLIALSILCGLTACGGGGGGGSSITSGITISGVAATGAAISGGTVEIKCSSGIAMGTTNADGSYSIMVNSGAQPCILRATDPVTKVQLHSIVENGSTTANITPVTDLVVANTLTDNPANTFSNFSPTAQAKITSANIATSVTRIQAVTASLGTDADLSGVDVMKGAMVAASASGSGDATDKKIDALMAALSAADKKIADLSAQVKTLTSTSNASSTVTSVVGDAQYGLANCPYARSGDFWVLDLIGTAPEPWNVNFSTMVLKNKTTNATYAINLKRDASNNPIACAFTSTVNGRFVEYRVSPGGVGAWVHSTDFGIFVPAQKTKTLTDSSFAGVYPALGFVKAKSNSLRLGLPMSFEIKADGSVDAYSCDLTKTLPDCGTSVSSTSADPVTCTAVANGTFTCSSAGGMTATAILFVTGNQAAMFMAVTNLNVNSAAYGGLIVLTKAPDAVLPSVGKTIEAGAGWVTGVESGSNSITSDITPAGRVESVNAAANSYTTSSSGSTATAYLNIPAKGFLYSNISGYKAIATGSQSGWLLQISKSAAASYYDGWAVGIKMK